MLLHLRENYPRREDGGGTKRELGIDIHTLLILCIKYITNENLLHHTGNSTQGSVVT